MACRQVKQQNFYLRYGSWILIDTHQINIVLGRFQNFPVPVLKFFKLSVPVSTGSAKSLTLGSDYKEFGSTVLMVLKMSFFYINFRVKIDKNDIQYYPLIEYWPNLAHCTILINFRRIRYQLNVVKIACVNDINQMHGKK